MEEYKISDTHRIQSFDGFQFEHKNNKIYFQFTNIPCEISLLKGFKENNVYRLKINSIPIYRLYEPNSENCNLFGTDYYFIPFEENFGTIVWKGYKKSEFSEYMRNGNINQCRFHELFEEGGLHIDVLIENIYNNNFKITYFHENIIKKEIIKIFYTKNVNMSDRDEINEYVSEWIIKQLDECIKKSKMIEINTESKMEIYMENMNDVSLREELLGEYGYIENRKYLFKIADIEYETFIKL